MLKIVEKIWDWANSIPSDLLSDKTVVLRQIRGVIELLERKSQANHKAIKLRLDRKIKQMIHNLFAEMLPFTNARFESMAIETDYLLGEYVKVQKQVKRFTRKAFDLYRTGDTSALRHQTISLVKEIQDADSKLFSALGKSLNNAAGYRLKVIDLYHKRRTYDITSHELSATYPAINPAVILETFGKWVDDIIKLLIQVEKDLQIITGSYPDREIKQLQSYYREKLKSRKQASRSKLDKTLLIPGFNPERDSFRDIENKTSPHMIQIAQAYYNTSEDACRWVETFTGVSVRDVTFYFVPEIGTAGYMDRSVFAGKKTYNDAASMVHELGHYIENTDSRARRASQEYYEWKSIVKNPQIFRKGQEERTRILTRGATIDRYIERLYPHLNRHISELTGLVNSNKYDISKSLIENNFRSTEFISVALSLFYRMGASSVKKRDLILWVIMTALYPKLEKA